MCTMSIKDEINFPIVSYPFVCDYPFGIYKLFYIEKLNIHM
jgi:hypothetical protein